MLNRGLEMSQELIQAFVTQLDRPEDARRERLALTPAASIGNAVAQARAIGSDR